jgi:hypothetical protein
MPFSLVGLRTGVVSGVILRERGDEAAMPVSVRGVRDAVSVVCAPNAQDKQDHHTSRCRFPPSDRPECRGPQGGDHLDGHREHREPHMPTGVFFNVSCVHPCPPKQPNASMEPWQAELLSVVQEYRS